MSNLLNTLVQLLALRYDGICWTVETLTNMTSAQVFSVGVLFFWAKKNLEESWIVHKKSLTVVEN